MEEIIRAFGIDWRLIVIQIFNFGLLVGVLWYFLYTPVLRLLNEREEKIKKGVENARKAEEVLKSADAEKNQIIKNAHTEASQIVARGSAHAEEKRRATIEETQEKIARDIANAKLTAEALKEKAIRESEAEIAKLAILAAEKVLEKEATK
jgi:F-type H+-transporting ATPase subunit b